MQVPVLEQPKLQIPFAPRPIRIHGLDEGNPTKADEEWSWSDPAQLGFEHGHREIRKSGPCHPRNIFCKHVKSLLSPQSLPALPYFVTLADCKLKGAVPDIWD